MQSWGSSRHLPGTRWPWTLFIVWQKCTGCLTGFHTPLLTTCYTCSVNVANSQYLGLYSLVTWLSLPPSPSIRHNYGKYPCDPKVHLISFSKPVFWTVVILIPYFTTAHIVSECRKFRSSGVFHGGNGRNLLGFNANGITWSISSYD